MRTLHLASPLMRGGDVAALQAALNARLEAEHRPLLAQDGVYGPLTAHAQYDARFWGGDPLTDRGETSSCPPAAQRLLERRAGLWRRLHTRRAAQRRQAAHPDRLQGPQAALAWAHAQLGTHEQPPGSNNGPAINAWDTDAGYHPADHAPWCAIFAAQALRHGGVILPYGCAYTPFLLAWARAGVNGLAGLWAYEHRQPGDLILFHWPGDPDPTSHVGLLSADSEHTIEGNAEPADGSPSYGGMVVWRNRGPAYVVGCARPRWPR